MATVPAIFWATMAPLAGRFGNWQAALTSAGQLLALVGITLFAVSLILSGRFKFLEKYFRGLNRIYVNHHTIGGIAFILLMVHPLVLATRFVPTSTRFAAMFLIGAGNIILLFGVIALGIMTLLLILTFYFRPKYHIWKWTHRFLGLAFVFAAAHVSFITSDVSRNLGLKIYILSLAAAALLTRLYRIIWRHSFVDKYIYTVGSVRAVGPTAVEIELAPAGKKMPYQSGQFAFFSFRDPKVGREEHPFSLASPPSGENIKIVAKVLGDFTARLKDLTPGTEVLVEGAYGDFNFRNFPAKKQVWIAGGIGITPFLGMARDLEGGAGYEITLYYCAKTDDEMMYFDELKEISVKSNNFKVIGFCQSREGFISAEAIKNTSGDFSGKDFLLCGPPGMMTALRKQFVSLGVKSKNIHSEEFEF